MQPYMAFILGVFCLGLLGNVSEAKIHELSVMAYNVRQLPTIPGREWDRQMRYEHLAEALHSMKDQPDVIIFQELFYPSAQDYLIQKLVREWADYDFWTGNLGSCCHPDSCPNEHWDSIEGAIGSSCTLTLSRGGVLIMSKYHLVQRNAYIYKAYNSGSADKHANKGFIHVKADELEVDTQSMLIRTLQISEMVVWVRDFLQPKKTEPIIVGGDMNVIHGSSEESELLGPRGGPIGQRFEGFHFHFQNDARDGNIFPVQSFDARSNWCAKADGYFREYDLNWHATLDYIFVFKQYKQPIEPGVMSVLPLKSNQPWYWYYLEQIGAGSDGYYSDMSDHYPVVATFKFDM